MRALFNSEAYVSPQALHNYATQMKMTHNLHMKPTENPFSSSTINLIRMEQLSGHEDLTRPGSFQRNILQALDQVSGAQNKASQLAQEAIINPGSVDVHDITIAQATAAMSLDISRNILSRLVQSWRDLINTR